MAFTAVAGASREIAESGALDGETAAVKLSRSRRQLTGRALSWRSESPGFVDLVEAADRTSQDKAEEVYSNGSPANYLEAPWLVAFRSEFSRT